MSREASASRVPGVELLLQHLKRPCGNMGRRMAYSLEMQVRDYELDQYGVVNNAVYLHYLEHARHEFLITLGLDAAEVARSGRSLALAEVHVRYRAPLHSRDRFTVTVAVKEVTAVKVVLQQRIVKAGEARPATEAETVGVFLDERGRLKWLDAAVRELFTRHLEPEPARAPRAP